MGDRDIPSAAGLPESPDEARYFVGRTWEGDIYRRKTQRSEGGVMHDGRERMRDRLAENREDASGAVDHRTVPATRLTTPLISS